MVAKQKPNDSFGNYSLANSTGPPSSSFFLVNSLHKSRYEFNGMSIVLDS